LPSELSYKLPLCNLVDAGEAKGQLVFDGLIRRLETAQSQLCREVVHGDLGGPIFASKPVPDRCDPAFAQLSGIQNDKPASTGQVFSPLLYVPALKEIMNVRFGATSALLVRHIGRLRHCWLRRTGGPCWAPGRMIGAGLDYVEKAIAKPSARTKPT
jgi:hypothetical protein